MARLTHGDEMHRDAGGSGAPFEEDPGSPGTGGRLQSGYVIVTSFGGQSYLVLNGELAALSSGDDTLILSANQETPGGGNDTKIKMLGGHGVVVPILAADPAGGASENGQLYYDSGTDKFRAYENGSWADLIPAGGAHTHVYSEVPAGTVDGANDDFTLAATPAGGTLRVYKNGLRQKAGAGNDYTLATATITFLAGNIPQTGDTLLADYES